MAVGFEFLLVHGLQIFPGFPLQIFLQIKAEVCASDIVSHRLLPPFQGHLCQIFVTFRCSTDIIKDCDTGFVIRSKIPNQAAATAYHVQPHQVRVVFIFAECGENISYILSGNCCNAVQVWCGNTAVPNRRICSTVDSSIFTPNLSRMAFFAAIMHWFTPNFSVQQRLS